jgi:hypothetical protein
MNPERVIHSGDPASPPAAPQEEADKLLSEIAGLYRERFRAMYNDDQPTLKTVNDRIALLKTQLTQL